MCAPGGLLDARIWKGVTHSTDEGREGDDGCGGRIPLLVLDEGDGEGERDGAEDGLRGGAMVSPGVAADADADASMQHRSTAVVANLRTGSEVRVGAAASLEDETKKSTLLARLSGRNRQDYQLEISTQVFFTRRRKKWTRKRKRIGRGRPLI